jgi:hypothetical protein
VNHYVIYWVKSCPLIPGTIGLILVLSGDDARELSALLPTVGVSGWERKKVLNEFKKCGGEYS